MNPQHSTKVNNRIETLCQLGCTQVRKILEEAKSGKTIPQLADCNRAEIRLIIDELDNIMSVYKKV